MRACAVIPAFDNVGTVGEVVRGAREHVAEVIVVDDGSTDGTGEAARKAGATVVTHAWNQGKGAALGTGLRQAWQRGCTHMIALDADGQHLPEDIPGLLEVAAGVPDAIVVGARPMQTADNVPASSRFGRVFSNFWVWLEGGQRVEDSQCGFRIYPVRATLELPLGSRRYDWEVEVLVRGSWAGMLLADAAVQVYYPPEGERVSHFQMFRDNVRISWLNFRLVLILLLTPGLLLRRLLGLGPRRQVTAGARSWSGRSYGGRIGHRIFAWGMTVLGSHVARFLMSFVVVYYWLVARPAVRASYDYQRRAFPPAGRLRRAARAYLHLHQFAAQLGEKLLLLARGLSSMEVRGVPAMRQAVAEALREGRGLILVTAHAGAWEVATAALMDRGEDKTPAHVVMFEGEEHRLAQFLDNLGPDTQHPDIITVGRDAMTPLRLLEVLRRGEILAVMGDRGFDPGGRGAARARFYGDLAPFPTTPYLLSALSGAPVIPILMFATGVRRYEPVLVPRRTFRFESRDARGRVLAEGVQWFASALEGALRRYPYQWYNFFPFWDQSAEDSAPALDELSAPSRKS